MAAAGYSGTPLAKKLGIKPGFVIGLENAPANYLQFFTDFPADVVITEKKSELKDLIHCFYVLSSDLKADLPEIKKQIKVNGSIWVSWHKKSSGIPTDITEDVIRDYALKIGLVDVKVCAVTDLWSGLKLVIPVKDRR
jgi:hypothetical protein